jgi:hypothetical protein
VPVVGEDTVARRPRRRGEDVTFAEVRELVEAWDPDFKDYTVAHERMQVYLDRALNPDPIDARTVSVGSPHDQHSADIVVGDDVGINVYRTFGTQEFHEFRALVSDCDQRHLLVWAYQLPIDDESRDQWAFARSRYTGGAGSVADIEFVHYIPEDDDTGPIEVALQYPEAALFALLSVVVGVALLVGSVGGGRSIIGGPLETGATSLVLIVLLILLRGANQ